MGSLGESLQPAANDDSIRDQVFVGGLTLFAHVVEWRYLMLN
jgi:hypothetical protein